MLADPHVLVSPNGRIGIVPQDRSRPRPPIPRVHRRLPIRGVAIIATGLAGVGLLVARIIPLSRQRELTGANNFGTGDNRRLLIGYTGMIAAVIVAPFLIRLMKRAVHAPADEAAMAPWPPVDPGPRPPPLVRRLLVAVVAIAILGWLFLGPGIAINAVNGHELVHLGYLSEMDFGRVLNVDTITNYGPLLGQSIFAFMKLTRFDLLGFRLYWHVVTILVLAAIWVHAWCFVRSRLLATALTLAVVGGTVAARYLPGADGIHQGTWGWANPLRHGWAPLALVALALAPGRQPGRTRSAVAGALLAAGAFYSPETAPGALVAFALVLLGTGAPIPELARRFGAAVAGGSVVVVAVLAPALTRGSGGEFLRETLSPAMMVAGGAANSAYPVPGPGGVAVSLRTLPYYLVPLSGLAALLVGWARLLSGRREFLIPTALALYATTAWITVMARGDSSHLLNVSLPWMLTLVSLADAWTGSGRRWVIGMVTLLLLAQGGLPRTATAIVGRVRHPHPLPPTDWTRLDLPRGGIWVPSNQWIATDARLSLNLDAIRMIQRLAGDHSTLIIGGQASLYYFLAGVRSATPFTDPGTEMVTRRHAALFDTAFALSHPEVYFVGSGKSYGLTAGYARAGEAYGLVVYQRLDRPPIAVP